MKKIGMHLVRCLEDIVDTGSVKVEDVELVLSNTMYTSLEHFIDDMSKRLTGRYSSSKMTMAIYLWNNGRIFCSTTKIVDRVPKENWVDCPAIFTNVHQQ